MSFIAYSACRQGALHGRTVVLAVVKQPCRYGGNWCLDSRLAVQVAMSNVTLCALIEDAFRC